MGLQPAWHAQYAGLMTDVSIRDLRNKGGEVVSLPEEPVITAVTLQSFRLALW